MPHALFRTLSVVFVLVSASLPAQDKPAPPKPDASPADAAKRREGLERELEVAKLKLGRATQDVADQAAENKASAEKGAAEIAFAEAKVALFVEREAPARLKRAQLELQGAKDGLADARDELQQLELMYKDSEIGDKTKDMVIARARRGLGRAEERLALQETDYATLETRTLPQEKKRLELDVDERRRDGERGNRAAEKAMFDRRLAETAAAHEVKRISSELSEAGTGK